MEFSTLVDQDPSNGASTEADIPGQENMDLKTNRSTILKKVILVASVGVGIALLVSVIVAVSVYTSNDPDKRRVTNASDTNMTRSAGLGNVPCTSDPIYLQTIRSKIANKNKLLCGLTILDKELFVVSHSSSEVEVYDSVKFSFIRLLNLTKLGLINAQDMVSCDKHKCLYIVDYNHYDMSKEILKIYPNGTFISNWFVGNDYVRSLSITDESNVILTFYYTDKLREYTPGGELVREINMSPDSGMHHLRHAVKLANGQFVVSHATEGGGLHRVCFVDSVGSLINSFGGQRGSGIEQMNDPAYLSVCGNGFIIVADHHNGRVLLLDSDLKFKREILSNQTDGLEGPFRIFLEKSNGRLFVGDQKNSRIFIFDFK